MRLAESSFLKFVMARFRSEVFCLVQFWLGSQVAEQKNSIFMVVLDLDGTESFRMAISISSFFRRNRYQYAQHVLASTRIEEFILWIAVGAEV